MVNIPEDRFLYDPNQTPANQGQQYYRYLSAGWRCGVAGVPVDHGNCKVPANVRGKVSTTTPYDPDATFAGRFTVLSDGPDRVWNFAEWVVHRFNIEGKTLLYAPTNGTKSWGIWWFGGREDPAVPQVLGFRRINPNQIRMIVPQNR